LALKVSNQNPPALPSPDGHVLAKRQEDSLSRDKVREQVADGSRPAVRSPCGPTGESS